MNRRALPTALLLLIGLAGPALATAAIAAPTAPVAMDDPEPVDPGTAAAEVPPPPPPEPGTVPVSIDEVAPRVLVPGEGLRLTLTLRNTGEQTATPRLTVHLADTDFISRTSLDAWRLAGSEDPTGPTVLTVDLAPLAPGGAVTTTVVVPPEATGLTAEDDWGARGLAVSVTDAVAAVPLGLARTFIVWFPAEVTPTKVTVAVPVVGPAVDPFRPGATALDIAALTGDEGRLTRLLDATEAARVTWAVDPAVLDDARRSGAVGAAWADRFAAAAPDHEILLLPWRDADLTALTRAGSPELAAAAVARSQAAEVTGGRFRIVWPAEDRPGLDVAGAAHAVGAEALMVPPGRLAPPAVLTYTPTGLATVSAAGDEVTALVPDQRLSDALLTGRVGPVDSAQDTSVTPAVAAQDLLAELAVINRERPATERHLLMTVPRDWNPDPATTAAQLAAIAEAPWVDLTGVSALLRAPDPEVDRGTLVARPAVTGILEGEDLRATRAAMADRDALAGMLSNPGPEGDPEAELFALASQAWRSDPAGRTQALGTPAAAAERLRTRVGVDPSSPINLISQSGVLPVRVTNDLEQDVTVVVDLEPAEARLVADESVPVTVPARDSAMVQVPLHAVGSGDVTVRIRLSTPQGHLVDQDTVFTVRVRAEWENIGTGILAGLLALGLLASIIRTARRGRSTAREAPIAESGPDGAG